MSKKKIALVINILIVILELIGLGMIIKTPQLEYYTIESNILTLIGSILFIIFYKKNNKLVHDLRFVATSCLTVTFLVVIFVLAPMYNFNYKLLMFTDYFLIFHTICPILSIISYIAFEERSNKDYLCIAFTAIYSIVLVILNVLDKVKGPYPFLMIKDQSILETLLWGSLILGGSYLIGLGLNLLNKKIKGAN